MGFDIEYLLVSIMGIWNMDFAVSVTWENVIFKSLKTNKLLPWHICTPERQQRYIFGPIKSLYQESASVFIPSFMWRQGPSSIDLPAIHVSRCMSKGELNLSVITSSDVRLLKCSALYICYCSEYKAFYHFSRLSPFLISTLPAPLPRFAEKSSLKAANTLHSPFHFIVHIEKLAFFFFMLFVSL